MASFVKDITPFYGTGEKNASGQTLEEFLAGYDPHKYLTPSCTTDAVVFSCRTKEELFCGADLLEKDPEDLKILLIKRSDHPSIGFWALPGGFAEMDEDLDATARRELEEETGVKGLCMEQLAVYGERDRDPRTRVITTAYMALVRESEIQVKAGDNAADAAWFDVSLRREETKGAYPEATRYLLHLENREKKIRTEALVAHCCRGELIRDEKFTVLKKGMVASDHAAIIVQALLRLRERMLVLAGKV